MQCVTANVWRAARDSVDGYRFVDCRWEIEMMSKHVRLLPACVAAILLVAGSGASWATEQAQQRRAGRDVRQETRQGSRHTKHECRAADQKSNSQCRQDKRQTKQHGRQAARNIKY
jgi:hypothetical protein